MSFFLKKNFGQKNFKSKKFKKVKNLKVKKKVKKMILLFFILCKVFSQQTCGLDCTWEILEDNTKVYATNAAIINNSTAAIEVNEVQVAPLNSWSLLSYDTNFDDLPENTKAFAMHILGNEANANNGYINSSSWGIIRKSGSLALTYDIKVPYFTYAVEEPISEVVFTISFAN